MSRSCKVSFVSSAVRVHYRLSGNKAERMSAVTTCCIRCAEVIVEEFGFH